MRRTAQRVWDDGVSFLPPSPLSPLKRALSLSLLSFSNVLLVPLIDWKSPFLLSQAGFRGGGGRRSFGNVNYLWCSSFLPALERERGAMTTKERWRKERGKEVEMALRFDERSTGGGEIGSLGDDESGDGICQTRT